MTTTGDDNEIICQANPFSSSEKFMAVSHLQGSFFTALIINCSVLILCLSLVKYQKSWSFLKSISLAGLKHGEPV